MRLLATPLTALLLLVCAWISPAALAQNGFEFDGFGDKNVKARLIADVESITPGQTFTLGIHLEIRPQWHVYWKNPEGPGNPVEVKEWVALPEGFEVGEIQWPAPHKFNFFTYVQFGYSDEVTLLLPVTAPADLQPGGEVTFTAHLDWLACDDQQCVPAMNDEVHSVTLPITAEAGEASAEHGLIDAARAQLPDLPEGWSVSAQSDQNGVVLVVKAPNDLPADVADGLFFYSDIGQLIDPKAKQEATIDGNTLTLPLTLQTEDENGEPIKHEYPINLSGALVSDSGFGPDGLHALAISAKADTQSKTTDVEELSTGFFLILGGAFLGGIILNLMPCVFPVLSIKILGFVKQAGENPVIVRRHGYAFGVGVLLSFWALAGVMLVLKAAAIKAGSGEAISWGFQMQNPIFILAMLVLVFLIGLNLAGVFEIGMGLTSIGQQATAGADGYTKSFLTGVLATLIATPCTGPFMGAALGATLTMPAWQAMVVFTALGIGMALPYVLLSCFPALLQYLPKPGPWMESFKQAMAFPMFATAGWLMYIYAGLVDDSLVLHLGFGLSALALGAWVYGRWSTPMKSTRVRWIGRGVALVFAVGGVLWVQSRTASIQEAEAQAAAARERGDYVLEWQPYSPELIQQLRAEGRPILVDFTAKWCGICLVNKGTSLRGIGSTEAAYRENNVALVVADFTKKSPALTKELNEFGRDGVPLYLVYPADGGEPEILPNTLSPDIVADAVKRAAGAGGQRAEN